MGFIKSLLRGLAAAGLKLGLVLFAFTMALMMVFGTSAAIKQALRSNHVYDAAIDSIVSDTGQNQDSLSGQQFQVTAQEPQIRQAAKTAFTPAVIQTGSEQVIDGVYGWLRSGSAQPDFRIDLTDAKQRFADAVADAAINRAQQLPACTLQQLRELSATTIDPFSVPCVPPGYDISALRSRVVSDILNDQGFLKDPVITADSVPKDSQGRSVFQNASQAPRIFHWLLLTPWVIAGLTGLFGAILVLLHDDKRRGLRSIAVILLGSGIFLFITSLLLIYVFKAAYLPKGLQPSSNPLQQPLLQAAVSLERAVSTKILWLGGAYAVLGTLGLLLLHFNHRVRELQVATSNANMDGQSAEDFNASVLPLPTGNQPPDKTPRGN